MKYEINHILLCHVTFWSGKIWFGLVNNWNLPDSSISKKIEYFVKSYFWLSLVLPDDCVRKITRPCPFCTRKYERTSGFFRLWVPEIFSWSKRRTSYFSWGSKRGILEFLCVKTRVYWSNASPDILILDRVFPYLVQPQ